MMFPYSSARRLAALLGILFLALATSANAQLPKTGVTEPTEHEKAWAAENMKVLAPAAGGALKAPAVLPSSVKNTQYLPAVGRQIWGACAAWAIAYYQNTYYQAKEHGWVQPDPAVNPERVSSPAFSYNLLNGGTDTGSGMLGNYEVLTKWGAATCAKMDPNWNYGQWPNEPQWRDAHPQRILNSSIFYVDSAAAMTELKTRLAAGDIATFVLLIYNNFVNYPTEAPGCRDNVLFRGDGGIYVPGGAMSAYHALTVVGYDDNKAYRDDSDVWHTGAFLVVNSWGQGWGVNEPTAGTGGFIWISYDYFLAREDKEVYFLEDRIGYQPTDFAVIALSHGRMLEVGLTIKGGDFDYPLWQFDDCFPRSGGERPLNALAVIDLTDYASSPTYSYWFTVHDMDVPTLFRPAMTGVVTHISVEKPGYPPWVSYETPIQTIEMQLYPYVPSLSLNVCIVEPMGAVFEEFEMGDGDAAWGDIDNDGDPDFVCQGWDYDAQEFLTRAYRNDGGGIFTNMDAGLPGYSGSLALGDYDNDGFLDVALSGYNGDWMAPVSCWTMVYRNENGAIFTDSGIPLFCPPQSSCQVAWVDYDDDGWLDLAVYDIGGGLDPDTSLYLYKNDKNGGLTPALTLTVPAGGQMAWADYNRDGLQDVAVTGQLKIEGFTNYLTAVYGNQYGSFAAPIFLPGVWKGPAAWGDYNNDGWLDLAGQNSAGITIFRNEAGASFTDLNLGLGLASLYGARIAWGDVDGNGLADLLVNGDHLLNGIGDVEKSSRVYANLGDGWFVNMGLNMLGVTKGGMYPVDYDSDGDLDVCVHGLGEKPYPLPPVSRIYENQTGGYTAYHTPSPPTGLAAEWPGTPGLIALTWDAASDADTPSAGLYYNVRAGRNPYSDDYLSGASGVPMRGSIVRPFVNGTQLGCYLYPEPPQPFFFSVQTIDPGLQASAWSKPCLVAPPGTIVGDVNQDGQLGVGDLVQTVRMSKGLESPDLTRADRNGDGTVDTIDVLFMRRLLLLNDAPDPNMLAADRVGPEGGVLEAGGFKLTVPPGSFQEPHDLILHRSTGDRPFGADSISPTYSLVGMPTNFDQDLQLELQSDIAPGETNVLAMIADTTFVRSLQETIWTHQMVPCSDLGEGKFLLTVPVPEGYVPPEVFSPAMASSAGDVPDLAVCAAPLDVSPFARSAASASPAADGSSSEGENLWRIGLSKFAHVRTSSAAPSPSPALAGPNPAPADEGGHFIIYFTDNADTDGIDQLSLALETAFNTLKDSYFFSHAEKRSWPATVTVLKLAPTVYGYQTCSIWGDNYGYMEFNEDKLGYADREALRITAGHEFFHIVQSLYDPRNRYSKAKFRGRHLWLDEAMSTWSETLFLNPPNPDYTPPFYNQFNLFFDGMHVEGPLAGTHGYGLCCLVKYLVNEGFVAVPQAIYRDIEADKHPVEAVCHYAPDQDTRNWYTLFVSEVLEGKLYEFTSAHIEALAPRTSKRWSIEDQFCVENTRAFYGQKIPDLGASLFMAQPNGATIPTGASFCAKVLSTDAPVSCSALYYKASPDTRAHLGFGAYMGNNITKIETDNFTQVAADGANVLLNVVNDRKVAPYTNEQTVGVVMGLAYDRTIDFTPVEITTPVSFWSQFPQFNDAGSIQGRGLLDLKDYPAAGLHFFWATVMSASTRTFDLNYTVTPKATVLTEPMLGGGLEELTFLGVDSYRLSLSDDEHVEYPYMTLTSPTGSFQFDTQPQQQFVTAYIEVAYTVSRRVYSASEGTWSEPETKQEEATTLVLMLGQ
ncbi:VCBS repeat-containing protein [Candidatus Sumerlaeota bacterium]|nr:VCBS repeat-containing protein [Candidatus Sumerlaeota bacterium]